MQDLFYVPGNKNNRSEIPEHIKERIKNGTVIVVLIIIAGIFSWFYLKGLEKKNHKNNTERYEQILSKLDFSKALDIEGLENIEKRNTEHNISKTKIKYSDEGVEQKLAQIMPGVELSELELEIVQEKGNEKGTENVFKKTTPKIIYKGNDIFGLEIEKLEGEPLINRLGIIIPEVFNEKMVLELNNIDKFANMIIEQAPWTIEQATSFRELIETAKKAQKNEINLSGEVKGILNILTQKLKEEFKNIDKEMKIVEDENILYKEREVKADKIEIKVKEKEYLDILSKVENQISAELENPDTKYRVLKMIYEAKSEPKTVPVEKIDLNSNIEINLEKQTEGQNQITDSASGEVPSNINNGLTNAFENQTGFQTENKNNNTTVNTNKEEASLDEDRTKYVIIRIYHMKLDKKSEGQYKINVLTKVGTKEEKLMTEIDIYNENASAGIGIYNYDKNSRIIVKKETKDNETITRIEKSEIPKTDSEKIYGFGSYFEFKRNNEIKGQKNIKYSLKYNANERKTGVTKTNRKSFTIETETEFKERYELTKNPKTEVVLNEYGKEQIDQVMTGVVFPQIQKILIQKIYQIQNLGKAV